MSSYNEAVRVLYNPSDWYNCSRESPIHNLDTGNTKIVERTVVTETTETESYYDIIVAKNMYKKIMEWKYGEGGTYENKKQLAERLRENTGKIEKHELDEYMNFKGED